ncbi:hypothetical protein GCM10008090_28260 [Arenicella chitinivorans]|uniref:YgjP-like metallopeptidase domain-containing protein n=1 Tax=Arenicella chitinivorans TaxID=1329800 RepID=A0A918VQL1_9GAMM|nr:SprT family zinc-dependent metalloprotease [Arenicella chitinivorans]GHA16933.1 hypothetical protein GCM10008090_28260 [Arenicella chitinivorans]
MKTTDILIDDLTVTIIRSARRRRLTLEVHPKGIRARAPSRMPVRDIVDFVTLKREWLHKALRALPERPADAPFADGATILLNGGLVKVRFRIGQRGGIQLSDNTLLIPVLQSHLPIVESARNKLVKWLKQHAALAIEQRVAHYAAQMSVQRTPCHTIKVRDYKRRWGSCDTNGNLAFNWRIIMAPPATLDYVVVHELAHCFEFNHSRRFWQIVEEIVPDRRAHQAWLDSHGYQMYTV